MPPAIESTSGEPHRLHVLRSLGLLDAPAEADFDRLTSLAARLLHAPTALVSLVDADRQFFASATGLAEPWATRRETPLTHSFCKTAVATKQPLIVADARQDPRVSDNLAIRDLGVVAYAGIPLVADKEVIGAFCVIDGKTRSWTADEVELLTELARTVERLIDLRLANRELDRIHRDLHVQTAVHQSVLAVLPDAAVAVFDRDLRFVAADGPLLPRLDLSREQLVGHHISDVHLPENVARLEALYRFALDGNEGNGEIDRGDRRLRVYALPLRDTAGVVTHGLVVLYDVTESHRHTTILSSLARALPNTAVAIFDAQLRCVFADGSILREVTGLDPEQLPGRSIGEALPLAAQDDPADADPYAGALGGHAVAREMRHNGRVYDHRIVPVRDDRSRVIAGLALLYDVSSRKREAEALRMAHERLAEQADLLRRASTTDELTALHNRRGFLMLAEQALRIADRREQPLIALFIDLNGMKPINDRLGHEAGDRALVATAAVLRACFRESDVVSRLGGDEFAVLAVDSGDQAVAVLTARIGAEVSRWNAASTEAFELSLSIGAVVRAPRSGIGVDALLTQADAAMYEQKRAAKRERS